MFPGPVLSRSTKLQLGVVFEQEKRRYEGLWQKLGNQKSRA